MNFRKIDMRLENLYFAPLFPNFFAIPGWPNMWLFYCGRDGGIVSSALKKGTGKGYFLMVEMNASTSGMPPWKMR
jgi:hypothetical protein